MRLTIEQRDLTATLKRLASVVQGRNTLPIIANVAIRAAGSSATFTVTDLDIEATATVACTVAKPGACTVGAKTLADIAAKLPAGSLVSIDYDASTGQATISAGRSRFNLATLPIEDFPVLASDTFASTTTLAAHELAHVFAPVFAASDEETRYYLQGVFLHQRAGKIIGTATDSHRFAMANLERDDAFPDIIVPRKTVAEVVKSFPNGDVSVSISATKVKFSAPHFTLLSKVIDGTFPDYTRVIPKHTNTVTFNADDMRAVIERVITVADDKSKGVKLAITADEITVSTRGAMQGASDSLSADATDDVDIGFNGGYVLDVLRQVSGSVTMRYNASDDPVTMHQNEGAMYILMPMRIQ